MSNRTATILKKILKLLYYLVISFVCVVAVILLYYVLSSQLHSKNENYRPRVSIYTIVSPSMTPVIEVYDVVVNVKVSNPKDIKVGDIITYISSSASSEGMTITHRVVKIRKNDDGNYEFLTQGDNNSVPDSLYVTFDKIIGKEILIIPKLGKVQFLISNKKSWFFLILIPIFLFILKDLYKLVDLLTLKKKVEEIVEEPEEEIDHEKQEKLKQELLNNQKEKVIKPTVNHKVEILDTDELTSKIKEYDQKIEELNKVIKEYKPKEIQEVFQDDTFLIGKQKVVSTVEAKSKKKKQSSINRIEKQIVQPEVIKEEPTKPSKPRLNLNPNDVKQVNRPGRKRTRKRSRAINKQKQRLIEIRKDSR